MKRPWVQKKTVGQFDVGRTYHRGSAFSGLMESDAKRKQTLYIGGTV